jgi:hypothetical protein
VVQFDFQGARGGRGFWLVLERSDVSVCLQHPKFDVDLVVTADLELFYRVWLGRVSLDDAMRRGWMRVDGSPALRGGFARWFAWSPMAPAVRRALVDVLR